MVDCKAPCLLVHQTIMLIVNGYGPSVQRRLIRCLTFDSLQVTATL